MSLFCKLFGHSVEVTHTNQHQLATRERCKRCGLSRSLNRIPETNCYQWVYNDGRESIGVPMFSEGDIKFGRVL